MDNANIDYSDDEQALEKYVQSPEPLGEEKTSFILNYQGETFYIDFKVSFDTDELREWLNIAKDIMAFANTHGGYLVFGIKDKTFERIGIRENDWKTLIDPDSIQKRINAYMLPPITSLTSCHKVIDNKNFIIIHIPCSIGETHIVIKEGKFKNKENKEIILLRKGEIYVRRSGSSILIEPNDLDDIIDRRINYYKEALLKNIVKVVEAPASHEILICDPQDKEISKSVQKFRLSSDPDAIPITGVYNTTVPNSDENEIITVIALFKKDKSHLPGVSLLYRIYAKRSDIALSKDYFKDIALISIYRDVPCFYWLQFLAKQEIENILDEIFERGKYFEKNKGLKIAACLGKSFFNKYLNRDKDPRHVSLERGYKQRGCSGLFFEYRGESSSSDQLEMEATELANMLYEEAVSKIRPDIFKIDKLWSIDYTLYAASLTKKSY